MTSVRISASTDYNPVYDLVRGSAAMLVFCTHLLPYILETFGITFEVSTSLTYPFSVISVEMFFALSGILLGPILYHHLQQQDWITNMRVFLLRRWYRTLPVYYLGLVAATSVIFIQGGALPENFAAYLLFLQSPFQAKQEFYAVSWSLCIEEIFYILFPLLLFIFFRQNGKHDRAYIGAATVIILMSFIFRLWQLQSLNNWDMDFHRPALLRLDTIAAGAVLGVYLRKVPQPLWWTSLVFIAVLMIFAYFQYGAYRPQLGLIELIALQVYFTLIPWACAVVILGLAQNWALKPSRITGFFADISYSLYIFHIPVMMWIFSFFDLVSLNLCIAVFYCAILFAYLVFHFIETPILKRRPKYAGQ